MRAPVIALAAVCAATAISVAVFSTRDKRPEKIAKPDINKLKQPAIVHISDSLTVQSPLALQEPIVAPKKKLPHYALCNLEYIKPPLHQVIVVNGTADTTVRFAQGTELTINPSDFVNAATGELVVGPVKLQVTEHYRMEDILLNDLSTATENGMLETNGMINIQALSAKGEACKLKKGGSIEIHFPIKNDKPGMQLFTAARDKSGSIYWVPMIVKNNKALQPSGNTGTNKQTADTTTVQPQKEVVIDTTLNTLAQFPGGLRGIEKNINNVKNNFPFLQNNAVVVTDFNVSSSGKVCWVQDYRSSSAMYSAALKEALINMPRWKPAVVKGKPKMMTMRLVASFSSSNPRLMKFWSCTKSPLQISRWMYDYGIDNTWGCYSGAQANDRMITNYVFTSTSLGWINCDRFYSTPQSQKIEMYVKESMEENTSIKMVFHNIRAVMNAGYTEAGNFVFANVPLGEPVTLVALKGNKDHLQMALKTVTISEKPVGKLTYVNVTADEVRRTMEQFNTLPGAVAKN